MFGRTRYQEGSLRLEERKRGPAVWVYRWWEKDTEGKPVRRKAQLANSVAEAYRKNHTIENYLQDSSGPDIDIEVQKVSIEDLRSAPYKATVDFYEIAYSSLDHVETKRTLYTAHFVFLFRDSVPNDLIQVNPLGLAVTYFREDEAFQ